MVDPVKREQKPLARPVQCPVCGCTFTQGATSACTRCPLRHGDCGFVKCPNCGFDIPHKSHIVEWFKKIFSSGKQ